MATTNPPNFAGNCNTIQLIEPDNTLLTGSNMGSSDPSLDESGATPLFAGQVQVDVSFGTTKASAAYKFEQLYVDILSDPSVLGGFTIVPTVLVQTQYGFTVGLSGAPPSTGYTLKWRVVVVSLQSLVGLDTPESFYHQIPVNVAVVSINFSNPRSISTYGFSELRVENLTDPLTDQTPIVPMVVTKTTAGFVVALSPSPPTNNYFLVARVP